MTKKLQIICNIPQGLLRREQLRVLEKNIIDSYRRSFAIEGIRLVWLLTPPGRAFVAGKPSCNSTLSCPVPADVPDALRHRFMRGISSYWLETTFCSETEFIVTVPDIDHAENLQRLSWGRIAESKRRAYKLKALLALLYSRVRFGLLLMTIDYRIVRSL